MEFGPTGAAAFAGAVALYNEFFDTHLKGAERDIPAVSHFLMGANEWRTADSWPPPEAEQRSLYLRSAGRANSARGDGALGETPPPAPNPPTAISTTPIAQCRPRAAPPCKPRWACPALATSA